MKNQKAKPVWLSITGFTPSGERNYRINAIQSIKGGFAEYKEIWCSPQDITLRHFEDSQLSMQLYSREEMEKHKYNPRFYNRCRFEILTPTQKQYIFAPNLEMARHMANQLDIHGSRIRQVKHLTRKEIREY